LNGANLRGADLAGADLSQASLAGASLQGADLAGAELGQADLSGADLHGASLSGADLTQADLTGADLRDADLAGVQLIQATLNDADLRGADLHGSEMTQAFLTGADLRDATLTDVTAIEASGLSNVRISIVSPHDGIQVSYLLLITACALLAAWWRRRISGLARRRAMRPADLAGIVIGIPLAVTGTYAACCAALRVIITYLIGWLWGVLPGPLGAVGLANPFAQFGAGLGAILLASIILRRTSARRPPTASAPRTLSAEVPADAAQAGVGDGLSPRGRFSRDLLGQRHRDPGAGQPTARAASARRGRDESLGEQRQ